MAEITNSPNAGAVYVPASVSNNSVSSNANAGTTSVSTTSTGGKAAGSYELKSNNIYTNQAGATGDDDGTGEAASAAAASAGLPYVSASSVNQMYKQTQNDPSLQRLKQQMLFFAQLGASAQNNTNTQGSSNAKSATITTGNGTGAGGGTSVGGGGGSSGLNIVSANGGTQGTAQGTGNTNDGTTQGAASNGLSPAYGPANYGVGSSLYYNQATPQLSDAARAAVNSTGMNIWGLVVVALKSAMVDQNQTLEYDLNKLQMYGKMSDQMAQYAEVLSQTQTNLDGAIQNQSDDKKKGNQEVEMPSQMDFGPSSMFTLDKNGDMLATQTAKPENAKNNANPVSAQGLNAKLQVFQQQRDQLQKNIDHWTNQYQSDNEVKNQLTTTVTSILKNMYDMQGSITRNINL